MYSKSRSKTKLRATVVCDRYVQNQLYVIIVLCKEHNVKREVNIRKKTPLGLSGNPEKDRAFMDDSTINVNINLVFFLQFNTI